jgi:hypothetical protein
MLCWKPAFILISFMMLMSQAWGAEIVPIALDPATGSNPVGPSSFVLVDTGKEMDLNAAIKAWEGGSFKRKWPRIPTMASQVTPTGTGFPHRIPPRNPANGSLVLNTRS